MNYKEIKKYVSDFENGIQVKSIELGGISVEYEIAIQTLLFDSLKNLEETDFSLLNSKFAVDKAVKQRPTMGYSGAQVEAVKSYIIALFKFDFKELETANKDYIIRLQKIGKEIKIDYNK
jgi:hypothetical protein